MKIQQSMPIAALLAALLLAGCPNLFSAANADVQIIENVAYKEVSGVDPNLLNLDIYVPQPAKSVPIPVVLWVHGGAWMTGDKANKMRYKPPLFTGAGYCFVSVNYRLSPTPPTIADQERTMHPIHGEDVASAIAWVHNHIGAYGGDPARMALLGHSAGAHLAALVSTNPSFLAAHGLPLTVVKGCAAIDTEGLDIVAKMSNDPGNIIFMNAFGEDELVWREASPITHVTPDSEVPPFFLASRGTLFRRGLNAAFAEAVEQSGSRAVVVDASVYSHSEVNDGIGFPGETVITPPLMEFFASVFANTHFREGSGDSHP